MGDYSLYDVWSMILNDVEMWSRHCIFKKGIPYYDWLGCTLFEDFGQ